MRAKMTEGDEWEKYERQTVTRQRERHNRVRSKSRRAHSHKASQKQKEALNFPFNRRGIRNEQFNNASVAGAARKKAEDDAREAERPAWMGDPSLLPKKPPGRS